MSRTRSHADPLGRGRGAIVLSCEHAGHAVPRTYHHLFAGDPDVLTSHRGYDIGIAPVAREIAAILNVPLIACPTTRLLIEVNRSLHHRALFSSFSRDLSGKEKQRLIEQIWRPHREAVAKTVANSIDGGKRVLHVSLHSFTPVLDGHIRNADIGLLYDPRRQAEKCFALLLQHALQPATKRRIRRNYPYRGAADGLTTALRRSFKPCDYLGLELEINQALLVPVPSRELAATFAETIQQTWHP